MPLHTAQVSEGFDYKIMLKEKKCRKCNILKPSQNFYRDKGAKDGLYTYCKKCHDKYTAIYQKKNPEKRKLRQRIRWKKRTPEQIAKKREKDRIYYWKNRHSPERIAKDKEKTRKKRLKIRFNVFQQDNFTCQYCGRKPPECILEIDHKYPKSKGGKNKKDNYITSCRECNRGKGDQILQL